MVPTLRFHANIHGIKNKYSYSVWSEEKLRTLYCCSIDPALQKLTFRMFDIRNGVKHNLHSWLRVCDSEASFFCSLCCESAAYLLRACEVPARSFKLRRLSLVNVTRSAPGVSSPFSVVHRWASTPENMRQREAIRHLALSDLIQHWRQVFGGLA